ncbi:MAG: DUF4369 domain-containing protein [Flavobacteriaceae bacterium]|nr:DUF4369 domain-containing protein [Flavobacteriaceae bacterium]
MNKIIVILIILLLAFSCKEKANINVTIKDVPNGRKVTLKKQVDKKIISIDSTTVQNGKFSFNVIIEEPIIYGIFIDSLKQGIFPLMDITDKINVIAYKDSLHTSKVSGSKMHTDLTDLRDMKNNLNKKMSVFTTEYKDATAAKDTVKIKEIQDKAKKIQAEISLNEWKYVKANPNSHVSSMVLSGLFQNPIYKDSIKPAFEALSKEVQNATISKQLKEFLEKKNNVVAPQIKKSPQAKETPAKK